MPTKRHIPHQPNPMYPHIPFTHYECMHHDTEYRKHFVYTIYTIQKKKEKKKLTSSSLLDIIQIDAIMKSRST